MKVRQFDLELKVFQQQLIALGSLAEHMVHDSVMSLLERNETLAKQTIEKDIEADQLDYDIKGKCILYTALHHPKASDLRLIAMAAYISHDLERIADKAVNISQRGLELIKYPPVKPYVDLPVMSDMVQKMVKDALDAFVNRDADLALDVARRDAEVDQIYGKTADELINFMEESNVIRPAISLLLACRHLERIGDLAENIGEQVYYLIKGTTVETQLA